MNKARTIGFTAGAVIACASAASADTVTQTLTFGPTMTDWSHTFSFAPFDSSLGTLIKVTDTITEDLAGTITFTNTSPKSATFTAHLTDVANKTFAGLTTTTTTLSFAVSGTLAPGASSGVVPTSGTSTASASTTTGLGVFEIGPVLGIATDKGSLSLTSSTGNASAVFTDTGQIVNQLVYTYTDPVAEPGTLAVLGSALAGLRLFRRKRKA